MKIRLIARLLFFSLVFQVASPVVIIVHGTGSSHKTWWNPGGAFFKEVASTAELLGERVTSFCWSGLPTFAQISIAGKSLAHMILSYPSTERITLIGHSHGGSVISIASQELFHPLQKKCGSISARPIREILEQAYQRIKLRPAQTIAHLVLPVPGQLHGGFDYTYTLREIPDVKLAIESYKASPAFAKRCLIDQAIYLATPVDEHQYRPAMDVIGSLLQLYSFGDNIQPVAGFFGRTYKQHPDIANVEVLVKEKYHGGPFGPDHFGIHMPLIGKWLLLVPEVLKYSNAPNHNFHKFAYGKNGVIVFDEAKGPQYMLEHEKNAYLAKYKTMPYLPPVGPKSSAAVSENIDDVPPTSNIIDLVQAHQPLDVEPT